MSLRGSWLNISGEDISMWLFRSRQAHQHTYRKKVLKMKKQCRLLQSMLLLHFEWGACFPPQFSPESVLDSLVAASGGGVSKLRVHSGFISHRLTQNLWMRVLEDIFSKPLWLRIFLKKVKKREETDNLNQLQGKASLIFWKPGMGALFCVSSVTWYRLCILLFFSWRSSRS